MPPTKVIPSARRTRSEGVHRTTKCPVYEEDNCLTPHQTRSRIPSAA